MITSPDNKTLKLIRKLRRRKHRDRLGRFVTEGEDLLEAGIAAGAEPEAVLVAAGGGLDGAGEPVERELLDSVSSLGSGTRVVAIWPQPVAGPLRDACVYLHGVADPGNVGTILRTVSALLEATVVLGPGCADPFGPKAVRAGMGAIFGQPLLRGGIESTPEPRIAMVARGGEPPGGAGRPFTICLGAERLGLPADVLAACRRRWSIPMREAGAESLNVAAAAAIACERISSPPGEGIERMDEHG